MADDRKREQEDQPPGKFERPDPDGPSPQGDDDFGGIPSDAPAIDFDRDIPGAPAHPAE